MSSITLKNIPYKIGPLTDTSSQLPINWIRNGEPLNGSTSNIGTDGTLNRVPLQLQQNIEVLSDNTSTAFDKINTISLNLDTINEALGTGAGETIAGRLTTAEKEIVDIKTAQDTGNSGISSLKTKTDAIQTDIGNQEESGDTYYRTVRDDLIFIKRQIGNDAGFDINGQTVDNLGSSGMKNKIESVSQAASNQETRIIALEDIAQAFDFSSMRDGINSIRNELGASSAAPEGGVYSSITKTNDSIISIDDDITKIKSAIDITNQNTISTRTTQLEKDVKHLIDEIDDGDNGISLQVNNVIKQIGDDKTEGSIIYELNKLESSTSSVEDAVGVDDTKGLRKRTSYIESKIGKTSDDQTATEGSILSTLAKHDTSISDLTTNVQNTQLAMTDKINDATDTSLYYRTQGKWSKAASSIFFYTFAGTVDTVVDKSTDIDISKGGTLRLGNNSSQVSNGFQINDEGFYDIDIELVVAANQSSSTYNLDLINGTVVATSSSGYTQTGGKQVVRLSTMVKIGANAMFKLALTSSVAQTTTIDSLRIKVKPII